MASSVENVDVQRTKRSREDESAEPTSQNENNGSKVQTTRQIGAGGSFNTTTAQPTTSSSLFSFENQEEEQSNDYSSTHVIKEQEEPDGEDDAEDDDDGLAMLMNLASNAAKQQEERQKKELLSLQLKQKQDVDQLLSLASEPIEEDGGIKKRKGKDTQNNQESSSTALVLVGGANDDLALDSDEEERMNEVERDNIAIKNKQEFAKVVKDKKLQLPNHDEIEYEPLKKNFFIPPPEAEKLSHRELKELQESLDGAKVTGEDQPPPIKFWEGIGLSEDILQALRANKFEKPFAIQALAIPPLMSGRDLLATAKTGSGKTLSFALPMLRHVNYQRRARSNEGPVGLVVAPTRELIAQTAEVFNLFCTHQGSPSGGVRSLRVWASYGGTDKKRCIDACKRGFEIMLATPDRLVDLLAANGGKTLKLTRCSFIVVDEADRMLDNINEEATHFFMKSVRPDAVRALISATMPREIRGLAKSFLKDYLVIKCDESPSTDVTQYVEIFKDENQIAAEAAQKAREEGKDSIMQEMAANEALKLSKNPRWLRLLQLLGDNVDKGNILVFMNSKQDCEKAMANLIPDDIGYAGCVGILHGSMEQLDRDENLRVFNEGERPILITTNVAERGIDVTGINLVISYACPNHYESYVHRIGRTGRAGKRGTAYTFFTEDVDNFMAPTLLKALDESGNAENIPERLNEIAMGYREQKKMYSDKNKNALIVVNQPGDGTKATTTASTTSRGGHMPEGSNLYRGFRSGKKSNNNNNNRNEDYKREKEEVAGGGTFAPSSGGALVTYQKPQTVKVDSKDLNKGQQQRLADAFNFAKIQTNNANADENDDNAICIGEYPLNHLEQIIRQKVSASYVRKDIIEKLGGDCEIITKGRYYNPREQNNLFGRTGAATKLEVGEKPVHFELRAKTQARIEQIKAALDLKVKEEKMKMEKNSSHFKGRLPALK